MIIVNCKVNPFIIFANGIARNFLGVCIIFRNIYNIFLFYTFYFIISFFFLHIILCNIFFIFITTVKNMRRGFDKGQASTQLPGKCARNSPVYVKCAQTSSFIKCAQLSNYKQQTC